MDTTVDVLHASAERFGERPALSIKAGLRTDQWSYSRLWSSSMAMAGLLRQRGVGRGDRVILWAPNSPQLVCAYFATWALGAIAVPLDPRTSAEFFESVQGKIDAKILITSRGMAVPEMELPVVILEELDLDRPPDTDLPQCPLRRDDIAEIVFTSGTTGNPKGVILTHGNIMANVRSATELIPSSPDYRLLSLLPLSHMFEMTVGLLLPISYGATVYYCKSRRSSAVLETLTSSRITAMVVVPQIVDLLLGALRREAERQGRLGTWRRGQRLAPRLPLALRRLLFRRVHRALGGHFRFFFCGGAYLDPDLGLAWENMGIPVLQGYGATECAPVITANSFQLRVPRSVGRPVPGVEVRLAQDGEILVRGENVTQGYWGDADATASAFDGEWYRTGDLGEFDAAGNLYLKGRKKDLIVLPNGQNVYAEDLERELQRESNVRDCAVLGVDRPSGGVQVHAVLLLEQVDETGTEDAAAEAVRAVNRRLAVHQQIQSFSVWPEADFPRTNTLKVKKGEVADAIGGKSGKFAAPSPPTGDEEFARLQRVLAQVSRHDPQDIDRAQELGLDLGFDSLSRVELAVLLEEEYGVEIEEERLFEAQTVADIEALIARASESSGGHPFPRWALSLPARLARGAVQGALLFPAVRACCRPMRVEGVERLRDLRGPALFIANHSSHLDTPTALRALPARIRKRTAVAAAADYFYAGRFRGAIVSLALGAFPFSREGAVRASLQYCGELVDKGWSILVYPEGTRSPTGSLQPFRAGIGLLASELRVPVVPIWLDGLNQVLPKGASRPRPGPVAARIGEVLSVTSTADYAAVTAFLEEALGGLRDVSRPLT